LPVRVTAPAAASQRARSAMVAPSLA